MTGLEGKAFIITGGGSGIGAATVIRLLAAGAKVVAAGRNSVKLAQTRQRAARSENLVALTFELDDEQSIIELVANTVEAFGRLDGLANVASAVVPEIMKRDVGVDALDPELWSIVHRINLVGAGLMTRESLPHLSAAGGGSIVNVSSAAAWLGDTELPAYAASKLGLHALTRHTARAWGPRNIRCNAVAPGKVLTETETGSSMMPAALKGVNEAILDKMCLPRLGQPEDVAALIAFLLSENSSWISGQVISIDGGLTMRE
jgi:NAD(P)-dependent dehydrogenase (short-subunit alcohol dehydrogenase family)